VSKNAEAAHTLQSMNADELDGHLRQQRRRLFEVRFQQAAGQVENHRQLREIRREIARTMTLQIELAHGHHLVSDLDLEAGEEFGEPVEPAGDLAEPVAKPRRRRAGRAAVAAAAEVRAEVTAVDDAEPEAAAGDVEPEDAASDVEPGDAAGAAADGEPAAGEEDDPDDEPDEGDE
jgi:large subunit ribosomal protein L29